MKIRLGFILLFLMISFPLRSFSQTENASQKKDWDVSFEGTITISGLFLEDSQGNDTEFNFSISAPFKVKILSVVSARQNWDNTVDLDVNKLKVRVNYENAYSFEPNKYIYLDSDYLLANNCMKLSMELNEDILEEIFNRGIASVDDAQRAKVKKAMESIVDEFEHLQFDPITLITKVDRSREAWSNCNFFESSGSFATSMSRFVDNKGFVEIDMSMGWVSGSITYGDNY